MQNHELILDIARLAVQTSVALYALGVIHIACRLFAPARGREAIGIPIVMIPATMFSLLGVALLAMAVPV